MDSDDPLFENLPAELVELHEALLLEPGSVQLRADLLEAYFADDALRRHPGRIEQVLWHVRNRPRDVITRSPYGRLQPSVSAEGFASVEKEWAAQHARAPSDPQIACGYACFLAARDGAGALAILQRYVDHDPSHAEVWLDMGRIAREPADRLRFFQEARKRGASGATLREFIASSAISANDMEAAQAIGRELLERVARARKRHGEALDWRDRGGEIWARALEQNGGDRVGASRLVSARDNHANDKHWGHTALGIVALRSGDRASAVEHLRASAEVAGNSRLCSYGPSFVLARELCAMGFSREVDAYLIACRSFWAKECIETWRADLASGRQPTFSRT